MNQSDLIAIAAVIVAIVSALYARRSATEAKKANEIALHSKMFEIYEEVSRFSDCFRGIFDVPSSIRIEQFRMNGLHRSEFYFSKEVHVQLQKVYEYCNEKDVWLQISQDEEKRKFSEEKIPAPITIITEYKNVLHMLYPALEQMKKELNEKFLNKSLVRDVR